MVLVCKEDIPLFKKSVKAVGKRALNAATEVAQDVADEKKYVKESIETRVKQAVGICRETSTKGAKRVQKELHQQNELPFVLRRRS